MYEANERTVSKLKDIGDISPRRYFFTIAVVLGLLFGFTSGDAEGTGNWWRNLLLWQFQSCLPMALLLGSHIAGSHFRWFEAKGPWTQLLISGSAGSVLFSPLALILDVVLMGTGETLSLGGVAGELGNLWPPVTLTWLAINAPFILDLRLRGEQPSAKAAAISTPSPQESSAESSTNDVGDLNNIPKFMMLVAPKMRGQIIYLQAELHYLVVVTDQGRSLILYNLRDAIGELGMIPGLQTHRSYWIALGQMTHITRVGRQAVVGMSNGDEVPVSRRRLDEVCCSLERPSPAKHFQ